MTEIFSNFTTILVIVGSVLALGIIFEEHFIALEDKFDAWWAEYKSNIKLRKETKNNAN